VLISAAWWPRATDFDLRRIGSRYSRLSFDISAVTTEQSLRALETALRETFEAIRQHGLRAVIVLQTPILLARWSGRSLNAPECLFRKGDSECFMAVAVHDRLAGPVNQVIKKVAAEFSNVRIFDPIPFLCPEERCSARLRGVVAYTDYEHISATTSTA